MLNSFISNLKYTISRDENYKQKTFISTFTTNAETHMILSQWIYLFIYLLIHKIQLS